MLYAVDERKNIISPAAMQYKGKTIKWGKKLAHDQLIVTDKGCRCYKYKYLKGKPVRQSVKIFCIVAENSDIIDYFPGGNLDYPKETILPVKLIDNLFDSKFNLPKYRVLKNKKIGKKRDIFDTIEHCNHALAVIKKEIDDKIKGSIEQGYELKITKEYLDWLNDDKPEKDARQKSYIEMQDIINGIKSEHSEEKERIKVHLKKLDTKRMTKIKSRSKRRKK